MKSIVFALCLSVAVASVPARAAPGSPLDQILGFVPLDLSEIVISFTDWSQIKDNLGLGFLTSASPLEFRIEMGLRVSEDQAAASAFGLSRLRTHAQNWGWDTADLDWEASIVGRQWPPIYILKLRHGFDFSPVAKHFTKRGFTQTESHGARVFSHPFAPHADWIRFSELSILNTAFLEEANLMILSSAWASLDLVLTTWKEALPSAAEDPFTSAAVEHLDTPTAAIILRGIGECLRFSPNPVLDLLGSPPTQERLQDIKSQMDANELLVPYRALAVGYRQEEGHPIGTIVFEYDTPELAATDLPARCFLAQEGMSAAFDRPISEGYFTLLDCQTDVNAIVLTIEPFEGMPSRIFRMVYILDAVFAACSSEVR